MALYFIKFIGFSYRFSNNSWLIYIFVSIVRKLYVLSSSFYRHLFGSSSLLPFFFPFERLIDFSLVCFYNMILMEGYLSRVFVLKFFIIRFFFLVFRFFFARFFMYCFFILSEDFFFLQRKKTLKDSVEVVELFTLFFFRFYTRKSYQRKTKANDYSIYAHSRVLTCLFFVMFITVIFFFNVRMSSIFPYGVCHPNEVAWFKYQKSQGITKYVATFWKSIWRPPLRFYHKAKKILWEYFVDFVFLAIKPLVAIELWFKGR